MAHSTSEPLDVICVGAGFSGRYVAYQAKQHNWSFAGFEIRPRSRRHSRSPRHRPGFRRSSRRSTGSPT